MNLFKLIEIHNEVETVLEQSGDWRALEAKRDVLSQKALEAGFTLDKLRYAYRNV